MEQAINYSKTRQIYKRAMFGKNKRTKKYSGFLFPVAEVSTLAPLLRNTELDSFTLPPTVEGAGVIVLALELTGKFKRDSF